VRPLHTRTESLREYPGGALWVLPGVAVVLALIAGSVLPQIDIPPDSPLDPLAFAGTADDARNVLTAIAATMVTVIALVLGLTIVALQVASTQFSPRLLRNLSRRSTGSPRCSHSWRTGRSATPSAPTPTGRPG
jgi:uncharacterized membrane protein